MYKHAHKIHLLGDNISQEPEQRWPGHTHCIFQSVHDIIITKVNKTKGHTPKTEKELI